MSVIDGIADLLKQGHPGTCVQGVCVGEGSDRSRVGDELHGEVGDGPVFGFVNPRFVDLGDSGMAELSQKL